MGYEIRECTWHSSTPQTDITYFCRKGFAVIRHQRSDLALIYSVSNVLNGWTKWGWHSKYLKLLVTNSTTDYLSFSYFKDKLQVESKIQDSARSLYRLILSGYSNQHWQSHLWLTLWRGDRRLMQNRSRASVPQARVGKVSYTIWSHLLYSPSWWIQPVVLGVLYINGLGILSKGPFKIKIYI